MAIVIVLGVVVAYAGICLAMGFAPAGSLESFRGERGCPDRHFHHAPGQVAAAYRSAASATPGMSIADEASAGPPTLLVDSRPTSRILGGDFGMVVRFRFELSEGGTVVRTDSRSKVRFALTNHDAALRHVERAVRERAKGIGLQESLVATGC